MTTSATAQSRPRPQVCACRRGRRVARTLTITENTRPKALTDALRRLLIDPASGGAQQVRQLDREIDALDREITAEEARLEALLADLYGLTDEERRLVKHD